MRPCVGAFVAMSMYLGVGSPLQAEEALYYGSRAGMTVTIVSMDGIGSSSAIVRIEHTPEDAKAFCVEYLLDNSMDCVRRTMAEVQLQPEVTADCEQGQWTDAYGQAFALLGRNQGGNIFTPEYDVIRLDTGEHLDGSSASGYDTALGFLRVLCPRMVE